MLQLDAAARALGREAHLDVGSAGLADLPVEQEPVWGIPFEDSAPVLLATVGDLVEPAPTRSSRTTSVTSSPP